MDTKNIPVVQKVNKSFFSLILLGTVTAGLLLVGIPSIQSHIYAAPNIAVTSEPQLIDAVFNAPLTSPYVIAFSADISLSADTTLTIPTGKHITLTGNYRLIGADGQSTITVDGTLTIDGVTVTHNADATGGSRGITVNSNATLYMVSGKISDNTCISPTNGNGGGVLNSGTFEMTGGEISGNSAAHGGGIRNNGSFTMYSGAISSNTATSGGGVFNSSTFTMLSGNISDNIAYDLDGGGVCNLNTFNMSGGAISGNTAPSGGGVHNGKFFNMAGGAIANNNALVDGGGIYNTSTFTMSGYAYISSNTAGSDGGGVYSISGTFIMLSGNILNNIATNGGGIYNSNHNGTLISTFIMSGGAISGNRATSSSVHPGGGGVYNASIFEMKGGAIANNSASGGGILQVHPYGGGVYNTGTLEMSGGTISRNTADIYNSFSRGGGVYGDSSTFNMSGNASISNNSARGGGGVFIDNTITNTIFSMSGNAVISNNSANYGGGVFIIDNSTSILHNVVLNMSGNAVISNNSASYSGGGIYTGNGSTSTMSENASISGNTATRYGGGVFNSSTFTMLSGNILNNTAGSNNNDLIGGGNGGGVFNVSGTFTMVGGTISGNTANFGGGVFNIDVTHSNGSSGGTSIRERTVFEISSGEISGNIATDNGGGVCNHGTFNLSGGIISNNTATNGGGIYNSNTISGNTNYYDPVFEMSGGEVSGNIATDNGGGIYYDFLLQSKYSPQTITINKGELSDNTAFNDGGGIWIDYKNLDKLSIADGVTFSNNKASAMYDLAEADKALYNAQIKSTVWTSPFIFGYNNYDIAYATTAINNYTITYLPGEHGSFTPQVFYNIAFGANTPRPQSYPSQDGWKFIGWDPSPSTIVVGDATFVAQWEQGQTSLVVTFVDWDGRELKTEVVLYGSKVIPPAEYVIGSNSLRSGYAFTGWNGSFLNITENLTLTAQYIATDADTTKHLVVFQDWNGTFLKGEFVADGGAAIPPTDYVIGSTELREDYNFVGWDCPFTNVTSDITVKAMYEPHQNNNSLILFVVLGSIGVILVVLAIAGRVTVAKRKKQHTK
ncbi:MAG: hypothetical protein FWC25_02735 [Dehalococcoidia bacterium]|nr:hypothetical protein [Dehalococcoidia bacterium]